MSVGAVGRKIDGWRGLVSLAGMGLLVAAILEQLRLPPEQRTWQGMLFGRVPYDLRPPTVSRFARTVWNPEQRAIIVPTAFGVGWTLNAAALIRTVGGAPRESLQ